MQRASVEKTLRWGQGGAQEARCLLTPCGGFDWRAVLPQPVVQADGGSWNGGEQLPVVLIGHLLAGGPAFFLTPVGQPPVVWIERHSKGLAQNAAGLVISGSGDVLLAAMWGRDPATGAKVPIFAGFLASMYAGDFLKLVLERRRLPLIFDLDETLIVAKSGSQLQKELSALARWRRPALAAAAAAPGANPVLARHLAALDREAQLMGADLRLLQEFASNNAVTINGQTYPAILEHCAPEDGSAGPIVRPVVRLDASLRQVQHGGDVIFTRINPHAPASSMIFRIRPNWAGVSSFLSGQFDVSNPTKPIAMHPPSPKLRFEVYVCTAAPERAYALEAWRVLDPGGWMIPDAERKARILHGQKVKSVESLLTRGLAHTPPGAEDSVMPLAVIVDDRTDVWEESCRRQVLQVEPFSPWQEQAAQELGLDLGAAEHTLQTLASNMPLLQQQLFNLRMHVYHQLNEVLLKQVKALQEAALDLSDLFSAYTRLLGPAPFVARLLLQGKHRQHDPDPLPAELPPVPPVPQRGPSDPRRRHQLAPQAPPPLRAPPPQPPEPLPRPPEPLPQQQALLPGPQPQQLQQQQKLQQQQPLQLQQQQQQLQNEIWLQFLPPPQQQPAPPMQRQQQEQQPQLPAPMQRQQQPVPMQRAQQPGGAGYPPQQQQQQQQAPWGMAPPLKGPDAQAVCPPSAGAAAGPSVPQPMQRQQPPQPPPPPPLAQQAQQAPSMAWSDAWVSALSGQAAPQPPAPRPMQPLRPAAGPRAIEQQQQQQQVPHYAAEQQPGAGPVPPAPLPGAAAAAGAGRDPLLAAWGAAGLAQGQPAAGAANKRRQGEDAALAVEGRAKRTRVDVAAPTGQQRARPAVAREQEQAGRPVPLPLLQLHREATEAELRVVFEFVEPRFLGDQWGASVAVGRWEGEPPEERQAVGSGAGPSQEDAMQAAAADALPAVRRAGGRDGTLRPHQAQALPAQAPHQHHQQQQQPPKRKLPTVQRGAVAEPEPTPAPARGEALTNPSNALTTLTGHFPPATNRLEWRELAGEGDGGAAMELTINGGEFSAVGRSSHPHPNRAAQQAKQHAALQVLDRVGYTVDYARLLHADGGGGGQHGGGQRGGGHTHGRHGGGRGPGGPGGRGGRGGHGGGPDRGEAAAAHQAARYERGANLDGRAAGAAHAGAPARHAYLQQLQGGLG